MSDTRFYTFVLRYQYDGRLVEMKDITLIHWFRIHLPFLLGYALLSFVHHMGKDYLTIENEFLNTLSGHSLDFLGLYLLFAALIQFGCMKTRYVILRKAPKEILQ